MPLEDTDVKAFFLVNPSNPASHALSSETIDKLAEVVEKNPDLIETRYDKDFAYWKKDYVTDIDFLNDLAEKKGVVLMYGPGFGDSSGNKSGGKKPIIDIEKAKDALNKLEQAS